MSLDGGFLHIVKTEIEKRLPLGSRIDKIVQPSRDEIVLTFRVAGVYERLLFSANAMSARVNLTDSAESAGINPGGVGTSAAHSPPMFCVMLRKHIGNGRLTGISQDGLERVLNFDFVCTNEIGDTVNNRLIIEIMGRVSNVILVNLESGKIIDSIKRVTDEISSVRRVLPNLPYEPPPRDLSRLCLLDCDIDGTDFPLDDKSLLKALEGVSPIFAREAAFCGGESPECLKGFLHKAKTVLAFDKSESRSYIVNDENGKPRDFCFMPITQYGSAVTVTEVESANALLDRFFAEKSGVERMKQRSGNIMKTLNNSYERLRRKIENQKSELCECKDRERFKIYGDLVNANIYRMSKGDTVLECENYITGESERIKLDPRFTPPQNAQKYYAAYRKLDTAEKMLIKLIESGERELTYLDSVIDAASRAGTDAEINAIREEMGMSLSKSGKLSGKESRRKAVKQSKTLPPLEFAASDGTVILVGRNNKQNDELTFKVAKPDDIWLHTKDIAGSHVILRSAGGTPPIEVITEAAVVAARHSKGRESSRVPVDYTFVKYVKKPSGSKPGYVIFTNNKTLFVNPN
ncbi:MAG: NFACT family protein [Oscillospiraceae bacterium]|nr:NFACT family protein [Oscillospiraceae bacterium]